MKYRFLLTTMAIVLVVLVLPFVRQAGAMGWLAGSLVIALIPLTSLLAFATQRHSVVAILALGVPFLALDAFHLVLDVPAVWVLTGVFGTLMYVYIIVILLRDLMEQRVVTGEMIFCAISIYLLIGVAWAGVYGILEAAAPGSFHGITEAADILYYSFIALTTVGFGDITPVSILARRLSVLEAAMGSIYMAIIVALIVGRYLTYESDKGKEGQG